MAVERALQHPVMQTWSNVRIANVCKVSEFFVRSLRKEQDGKPDLSSIAIEDKSDPDGEEAPIPAPPTEEKRKVIRTSKLGKVTEYEQKKGYQGRKKKPPPETAAPEPSPPIIPPTPARGDNDATTARVPARTNETGADRGRVIQSA